MWFVVFDGNGSVLYEGESWPMARAALDFAVMQDLDWCPDLNIFWKQPES